MRGNAAILVILGVLAVIGAAVAYTGIYKSGKIRLTVTPTPASYNISNDPKYSSVKEKYNLSQEQLEILSTVNPDDND